MCQFPSWTEMSDGTILFLTDDDIANLSEKSVQDCCGHSALHEIYLKNGGTDREGWPCPPMIAKAIRAGKMRRMAKAGGITAVEVNTKGFPALLSVGGYLYLDGLKTLPANAKLSAGDTLDLDGLKTLPANAKLSAGGSLCLDGLKSLPANAKLSAGGSLYLGGLKTLPANAKLSVGGTLYLSGLKSLPANAKLSAGGYLYLGGLKTLPANAKLSVGGTLYLGSWFGRVKDAPRDGDK